MPGKTRATTERIWILAFDDSHKDSRGRGVRWKTRTTTKRAWFPAEGGKSAGGVSERIFLAGENARVFLRTPRTALSLPQAALCTPPLFSL